MISLIFTNLNIQIPIMKNKLLVSILSFLFVISGFSQSEKKTKKLSQVKKPLNLEKNWLITKVTALF